MAYGRFRRYRRIGWRRRRGYFGRRRYRRGYARRYVNATSRSSIRMKTAVTLNAGTRSSGHGDTLGTVFVTRPLTGTNSTLALVNSPLFQAYSNLYEEMKLIGMKLTVNVTTPIGSSALPSLQIYTAWDRRHGYNEADPTADNIRNMATSNVATALNNNVAKITRSIYASDLIEKAQWIDTDRNDGAGGLPAGSNKAWTTAAGNPNFFCPSFFMCFGSPALAADTTITFSISCTYYVAFRNPKFGGSSSAKDLPVKEVEFLDDMGLDDDDDMDVDRGAPATDVERTINQSRAHRAALVDAPGPSLEPPERPVRRRPVVVTPPKN